MDDSPTPLRIASEDRRRALPRRFIFTEAKLAGVVCPSGKASTSVYDSKVGGLCYVVTAAGSRSYYLYRKWRGRKINELLGKASQINVERARELAIAMNARINAGVDVQAERRRQRATVAQSVTVSELWQRYKADHLKLNATATTRVSDESLFKALAPIADRRVDSISVDEFRALHRRLGIERGKQTADHALKLVRRMINFARIMPNIVAGGTIDWFIGKHTNERTRYLTAEEMPRFLAALESEPSETLRDFIKASLIIGQRRANMQSMRWSELDLDAAVWTIPGTKHKTRRDTRIPLTPIAVELLMDRRRRQGAQVGEWVFPALRAGASRGHITEPRYALERICTAAKISDLTIHDLRRSMGVWMALGGTSELLIGASLGHRDREATRRYSHIAQLDPVREGMTAAVNRMFGVVPAVPAKPKRRKKPVKRTTRKRSGGGKKK